ncbi:uncharacterized protein LOC128232006 isoform X2 [Mya arenaria]|uniref:uncharacterized protein LOC128232006 isoform X2 n=1 Tax=Mya arenaria TaxID=6604 RepID=UPI0022E5886B|nr:uncharacterized protein LOC128232006 isoform X2 [Mya arenaria]XP_052801294.1 uncharacterized protein LOC128232006 isoform X2 [Mya arenaria]
MGRKFKFLREATYDPGDHVHKPRVPTFPRAMTMLPREMTYLGKLENTFFSVGEKQVSEEGRKRASTLPPLEREPTFQRKPKYFNPYEGNAEEAADSHWRKSYEKVSVEVDNKVKSHLKRQLLVRFERRLKRLEDAMSDDSGDRHGPGYNPWEGKHKHKKNGKSDIFHKYTETGERASSPASMKSDKPLPDIRVGETEHLPDIRVGEVGDRAAIRVQFPEGHHNGDRHVNGNVSNTNIANGDHTDGAGSDGESLPSPCQGEFDVADVKFRYSDEHFRHLDVSPVQTPQVIRPMTREQTRLSFDERMSRILRGHVHVTCPIRNKVIRVYLCSGFIDSEAERTFLLERVYPEMQELCALHGREFQMVDPHWGLRNSSAADDHSVPAMCLENLERCCRDQLQPLHAVVLLTDKYGEPMLPSILQMEEFETAFQGVTEFSARERAAIEREIAVIEPPTSGGTGNYTEVNNNHDSEVNSVHPDGTSINGHTISQESSDQQQESSKTTAAAGQRKEGVESKKDQQRLKELRESIARLPSPKLLATWYRLDENALPPVYRLQNISTVIKDYGRGDANRKEYSRQLWADTAASLLALLNTFGSRKFNRSLLETELEHLLENDVHSDQCIVVCRTMDDLEDNLDDLGADDFADVTSSKPSRINRDAQKRLMKIKKNIIPQKVNEQYIINFPVSWAPGGVRVGGDRSHQTYLDRLARHLCDVIRRRLLESFKEDAHAQAEADETGKDYKLFDEMSEHVHFFQERSRSFQGMKESLHVIKAYIRSTCRAPLVVHGRPGAGKSALLAKAARETHKWLKGQSVCVLVRSVGATQASRNIRHLLYDVCRQLSLAYTDSAENVPTDYVGLVNEFSGRMALATEDRPLVIYLDALDNLEDDHNGRKLAWLPRQLPSNVHVVVSTLPDDRFDCMPTLRSLLGDDSDMFLEIPDLQESDAMIILNHLCNTRNRTLTQSQFDTVFNILRKCPSPLFLKLLFEESMQWCSYTAIQESKLPDSIKKLTAVQFGRMEMKYGEAFVRRALGYITASRNGITDQEMIDMLSLDDAVMAEVAPNHTLVRRRVPPSLWLRLRRDLSVYLTEIHADHVRTIQWAHAHFNEAATERYLKQKDKAPSYHRAMAEYFLGLWVEKPKPYPGYDKGVLRYVAPQPLYWEQKDAKNDGSGRVYNLRKINELPYHLLNSNQMQLYKSETMCNFEWVLAKLCGTSLRSLVEEYHIGLEAEPSDNDLKLLSDTLQLSATAVLRDPRQLAGQLVGRVQGIVNRDVPATPGDPPRYPFLHGMVAQAKNTSIPALVPSIGCLTEPGGILYDLLSGHMKPITAVTTTTDAQRALTASEDNTLKVWDLKSGKVTSTLYDFGKNVTKLRTAFNNKFVIAVEGSVIKIWSLASKECCSVIDQYLDPPVLSIASEGKLLVGFFDGAGALRTWDLENEFRHVCETKIEGSRVYSDNAVVMSPNSYGDYVLYAFRGANWATIQHARSGKVIHKLKCHEDSSSIVALAITRDYMVLACRQNYMKLHEIHQLELFDAKKGKYLRSIRGCTQDFITELHINLVGSHAIVVCASETSNASNIAIWNLETEDHKHLAKHSGVSTVSACADFRYCLTAQKGDNTLKIWNISKFINQPMPKMKKSLGVAEIHPMIDNPRYAIARQVNHGPISIWNVAKAKCLASAVRIERGLSESSDVVLIRNINVVILTERGLKDSKPVFKTVLIYDLRAKRYVKKLTQCFIVPSPAHEYILLDGITLLGPAETRNHFIIWSLETGRELFRIRPQFVDVDVKGNIKEADLEHSMQMRASTAKMTPWDRRTESSSAKRRRREKAREEEKHHLEEILREKKNGIEQFIISGDLNVIVASFFAHHLCVFNVSSKLYTQTLENENSMLFLHVAALNFDGSCLVHANYDEASKVSYVTLWDTTTGHVKKRLKNETDVLAIAITDNGNRVVFGKANKELRIWDPMRKSANSMKKVKGYDSLEFDVNSKIFILNDGKSAVVFAGDISLWDLENATLLAAFTPDTRIEVVTTVMSGQLITIGVHEYPELVVLKMTGKDVKSIVDITHEDLFGESTGDTSDEEEDEEDDL